MRNQDFRSQEQQEKEAKSRQRERLDQEDSPGFGDKKLEGPDHPST